MITKESFGRLSNGTEVTKYILDNGVIKAHILDYGCAIQALYVKDNNGNYVDVVLGYDTALEYELNGGYLGAFVGRVANRTKDAKFSINGKNYKLFANDGKNSLHGGQFGFDKKIYNAVVDGENLIFTDYTMHLLSMTILTLLITTFLGYLAQMSIDLK